MKKTILLAALFCAAACAQTLGICIIPPGTTGKVSIGPCPPPVATAPTLAQIVAVLPTTPIANLAPGVLYFTLDQVTAITFCVAGTASPGCPGPVTAAITSAGPLVAVSAQAPDGTKPGPAFWVPTVPLAGSPSQPK